MWSSAADDHSARAPGEIESFPGFLKRPGSMANSSETGALRAWPDERARVGRELAEVLETLSRLLSITVVIFMIGSLLEMGLKLDLPETRKALRNVNFLVLCLAWSFLLNPALALLLTKTIPLAKPYALGLMFLGMAPCAPFLPMVAQKAGGDLSYVAAFMVLAAVGTAIYMPFAVPILVPGFSADAWTIAKPLVFFILLPLAIGAALRSVSRSFADKILPAVKRLTDLDILLMLVVILLRYGKDYLSAVGSYAIGTQFLYYAVVAAASYWLGFGLAPNQKSVLALGLCTRNIGAAVAPLMAVPGTDQRAVVMCLLGIFTTMGTGLAAAALMGRRAPIHQPA